MEENKVTFTSFRSPCPICGQWLDCITSVHAEKHGLTRDALLAIAEEKRNEVKLSSTQGFSATSESVQV